MINRKLKNMWILNNALLNDIHERKNLKRNFKMFLNKEKWVHSLLKIMGYNINNALKFIALKVHIKKERSKINIYLSTLGNEKKRQAK